MDVTWQIRPARSEDSDGLKSCMESAYAVYMDRMGGARPPPMDVDYSSEIRDYPAWVVDSKGSILGGLIMTFEGGRALIANIAVDPEARGKGRGGALMAFAESMARKQKFSEIHLATHTRLHENISLYQHLGWEETGRDETRVFMKKEI